MKKHILLIFISLFMVMGVTAACGNQQTATEAPAQPANSAATKAPAQSAATEAPAQPAATEAPAQPAATEAPAQPANSVATGPVSLNGAGATFPLPVYTEWIQMYKSVQPDVTINYQGIGSGGGQKAILDGTVDFAGSDSLLK